MPISLILITPSFLQQTGARSKLAPNSPGFGSSPPLTSRMPEFVVATGIWPSIDMNNPCLFSLRLCPESGFGCESAKPGHHLFPTVHMNCQDVPFLYAVVAESLTALEQLSVEMQGLPNSWNIKALPNGSANKFNF